MENNKTEVEIMRSQVQNSFKTLKSDAILDCTSNIYLILTNLCLLISTFGQNFKFKMKQKFRKYKISGFKK